MLFLGDLPRLSCQSKWSVSSSLDQLQSVFSSKEQFPIMHKVKSYKLDFSFNLSYMLVQILFALNCLHTYKDQLERCAAVIAK